MNIDEVMKELQTLYMWVCTEEIHRTEWSKAKVAVEDAIDVIRTYHDVYRELEACLLAILMFYGRISRTGKTCMKALARGYTKIDACVKKMTEKHERN